MKMCGSGSALSPGPGSVKAKPDMYTCDCVHKHTINTQLDAQTHRDTIKLILWHPLKHKEHTHKHEQCERLSPNPSLGLIRSEAVSGIYTHQGSCQKMVLDIQSIQQQSPRPSWLPQALKPLRFMVLLHLQVIRCLNLPPTCPGWISVTSTYIKKKFKNFLKGV